MALLIILRLLKNGFTRMVNAVWQRREGVGSMFGVLQKTHNPVAIFTSVDWFMLRWASIVALPQQNRHGPVQCGSNQEGVKT
jgi:hypothetical protein